MYENFNNAIQWKIIKGDVCHTSMRHHNENNKKMCESVPHKKQNNEHTKEMQCINP